jgi:formiminotetrahydrofolate cyclodeaminase
VDDLFDRDVGGLLELFAQPAPTPGVVAAAALVTAAAAALVAKVARLSKPTWGGAAAAAAQADALRDRVMPLAQSGVEAHAAALARLEGDEADADADRRDFELGRALKAAAAVPLRIADVAADVAELAAFVAEHGIPSARADAAGAAILAASSAKAAALLVETNLAVGGDARRASRYREAIDAADSAVERALRA